MDNTYLVFETAEIPHVCVLSELMGIEKPYQLRNGVPLADSLSGEAAFKMDPDYPTDTVLADCLINRHRQFIASSRLKAFLETRRLVDVEYLPVDIIDHKGRPIKQPYYIVHPIHPVDCLDIEKCGAKWSRIDKTAIQKVEALVIDASKVDPKREFFRPKHFHWVILVRSDLADAIDAQGFTGIRWIDPKDFPEK